ncbi:CoA ester lyase [Uliginosibacterium sediminicola]|uniref:CoA ester lyase n=1 Tax=Uliginosibacterium sediminicola TaxID=2024550 RepID=A0ABU9Z1W4_9RHOO
MALPISYLFVPGNRPERFDKALASAAGAVIIDLEDAVAPADKAAARSALAHWLSTHDEARARLCVRINDCRSADFRADLDCLAALDLHRLMLPKAESADDLMAVIARLGTDIQVIPLIETARGVQQLMQIAAAPCVQRLAFGTLDYAADLELSGDPRGLLYPASQIAIASRCAGIGTPIAGVTAALQDPAALAEDIALARACGFGAKLCIHPAQLEPTHSAFRPSADELAWAQRVIAAASDSKGAVQLDGKMIDPPVLRKAQAIVDRASL